MKVPVWGRRFGTLSSAQTTVSRVGANNFEPCPSFRKHNILLYQCAENHVEFSLVQFWGQLFWEMLRRWQETLRALRMWQPSRLLFRFLHTISRVLCSPIQGGLYQASIVNLRSSAWQGQGKHHQDLKSLGRNLHRNGPPVKPFIQKNIISIILIFRTCSPMDRKWPSKTGNRTKSRITAPESIPQPSRTNKINKN